MYLCKYDAYARNPRLSSARAADLRAQCLLKWNVPDVDVATQQRLRQCMTRPAPALVFQRLTGVGCVCVN